MVIHEFTCEDVFLDNITGCFSVYISVNCVRHTGNLNLNRRFHVTETHAAGLLYSYVLNIVLLYFIKESIKRIFSTRGYSAGSHTDYDMYVFPFSISLVKLAFFYFL